MSRHLTGFDEEVQLGQLGEILENDSVVMTVELSDEDDKPLHPVDEPLWRGVTMLKYEKGRWHRQSKPTQAVVSFRDGRRHGARKTIRQKINLEPNDSTTLFGIRPVLNALGPQVRSSDEHQRRHPVSARSSAAASTTTRSLSDANPNVPRHESPPGELDRQLLSMPPDLERRLRQIAEPQVGNITTEGQDGHDRARAGKLEWFLRDSGLFTYTLQMDVIDHSIDPVQDFLDNRKQGHCEYFASALALLLRSVKIPSRVVNGFKGGDWNELTETLNVRQKHAHSWVEAFVGLAAPTETRSGSRSIRRPPPSAASRSPRWGASLAIFAR